MGTLKPQSNTVIGTMAVYGWAGLLHMVQRGRAWAACFILFDGAL